MDISDLHKVINRKRINVDADKLREKLSQETKKIIKLKVAQDTAYWDIKEKLQQVEGNHERLQQNMVDVQMQHETISGQYQDELRHRPETLNKMNSTRSICDVLEVYSGRLKETLERCASDHAALKAAFQSSGEIVQGIQQQQRQTEAEANAKIVQLEQAVQLTTENRDQLVQLFNSAQQQQEQAAQELKQRLQEAEAKRDQLLNISCELTRELDRQKHIVEMRDKSISDQQGEMKRLMQECTSRCNDMKNIILKQETDLNDASSANEDLKRAVSHQEEFTSSICRQRDELQEKLASLEDEAARLSRELASTHEQLQKKQEKLASLEEDFARLTQELASTQDNLQKKQEYVASLEEDVARLTQELASTQDKLQKEQENLASVMEEGARVASQLASTQDTLQVMLAQKKLSHQHSMATCEAFRLDVLSLVKTNETMEKQIQNMQQDFEIARDGLKGEIAKLLETNQGMEKDIEDKNQQIAVSDCKIENLTFELKTLEHNHVLANGMLDAAKKESADKSADNETLNHVVQEMQETVLGLETSLKEARADAADKLKELTAVIERAQEDNAGQAATITKLMTDLSTNMKIRIDLDNCLDRLKREGEAEREAARQKEQSLLKQVEAQKEIIKEKDEDYAKQMTLIKEIRAEKDKLQVKIDHQEVIIDNVEKSVKDRERQRERERAETQHQKQRLPADQDDNAVSFTTWKDSASSVAAAVAAASAKFAVPAASGLRQKADPLFNLFSDSSVEGDTSADRPFVSLSRRPGTPTPTPARAAPARGAAVPAPASKRLRAGQPQKRPAPRSQSPIVGSQRRDEPKKFFKTRPQNKFKEILKNNENMDLF